MTSRHWHFVLIRAVGDILRSIFEGRKHADKAIEFSFKQNKKWGKRDRHFVAETVYDIVRYYRLLDFFSKGLDLHDEDPYIVAWALYEVWKYKEDPTEILKDKGGVRLPFSALQKAVNQKPADVSITLSFPEWLYKVIESDYKEGTECLVKSLNEPAPVCLRANLLKASSRAEVQERLSKEGIETRFSEMTKDGLILPERKNVFATQAFKDGLFEVQDIGSQLISELLDPQAGERVADSCAGAGGKSLHIASLMNNRGEILASDVIEWKLTNLKLRARRAGVSNLRIQKVETKKDIKKHIEKFDRVLIDAPCSGTGVIRRNPDTKWKLTSEEVKRLCELQKEILDSYAAWVKPGGILVYATCSILKRENEDQVVSFLERHGNFSLAGASLRLRPDKNQTDGFFAQKFLKA